MKYIKAVKAPKGIKIRELYFTFGRYNGTLIFEALDERAPMKFVMETGFAIEYTMETRRGSSRSIDSAIQKPR